MKRWSGYFILCFILFGAFAFIAADNLSFDGNPNYQPKGSVSFSVLEQESSSMLYSGKTLTGENFIYTLEIKSKTFESFINPKIEESANIHILSNLQVLNSANCEKNGNLNSENQSGNNNKSTALNSENETLFNNNKNETSLNKYSTNNNANALHINHINNETNDDSYINNSENGKILIRFYIKSGTQINFNFSADNYAKDSVKYNAIPYSDFFDIEFFNLTDENSKEYNLETINSQSEIFKLYNVDESFFEQATEDGFLCFLDFALIFNDNIQNETMLPTDCIFNVYSTKPNVLKIDFDEIAGQGKIKPKSVGTATTIINIEKYSDSGYEILISKSLKFEVVNVPVDKVENLPEKYSINLAYSNSADLNLTVSPIYAKLQFLLNDDENNIILKNDKIISLLDKNNIDNDDILEINFYMILKNKIIPANIEIINKTFAEPDIDDEYSFEINLNDVYTPTTTGLIFNKNENNSFTLDVDLSEFNTEIEIYLKIRLVNKTGEEVDCNFLDPDTPNTAIFELTPKLTADFESIFMIISSAGTATLTISHAELPVFAQIEISVS
ncbi:MAG: hypothetical protein PHH71_04075 [Clostridia bacterium]|nr:hypothetical protein [Clostridia bacterium]